MFDSLGNKFTSIIKNFSFNKGAISENDLNQTLQDIRVALLESDVNMKVSLKISNKIKEKALGFKIVPGVTPQEMIVKISHDSIKEILEGNIEHGFKLHEKHQERILLVGLQGSGKTTTAAKIAHFVKEIKNKTVLASSLDYYRPAARKQLKILCDRNNINYYDYSSEKSCTEAVIETLKHKMNFLKTHDHDVVIVDTAGRISIDEKMMDELVQVKKILNPTQIILVLDSMSGRTAIDVAKHFNENLCLTGVIFTKTDSDTKSGAILSIRQLLDLPILFLCSGEKIQDLDEFIPERIAQRILGMGDIVSLVEKASSVIPNDNSEALKNKAKDGKLDLFDVLEQFKFLKKLGGLPFISKFLPADMVKNSNISEDKIKRFEAIILSMTPKERVNPGLVINSYSRKNRISKGSGTDVKLVEELLNMHGKISKMAQQFAMFDKNSIGDKFKMGDALKDITKK
jgi:signal recognition particle subunit SRP54